MKLLLIYESVTKHKIVFHVTTKNNLQSILTNGLGGSDKIRNSTSDMDVKHDGEYVSRHLSVVLNYANQYTRPERDAPDPSYILAYYWKNPDNFKYDEDETTLYQDLTQDTVSNYVTQSEDLELLNVWEYTIEAGIDVAKQHNFKYDWHWGIELPNEIEGTQAINWLNKNFKKIK